MNLPRPLLVTFTSPRTALHMKQTRTRSIRKSTAKSTSSRRGSLSASLQKRYKGRLIVLSQELMSTNAPTQADTLSRHGFKHDGMHWMKLPPHSPETYEFVGQLIKEFFNV